MRFVELVLTLPDDQIRVGFHEQLTVLGGLPEAERSMLLTSVLGAGTGSAPQTKLRAVDAQGRVFTWSAKGAWYEDGTPARPLVPDLLPDTAAVRAALVVSSTDLGLTPGRPDPGLQAELDAALEACRDLELEIAAHGRDDRAAGLRVELAAIEQRLVEAEDSGARRAHHEVSSALAETRAELALVEDLVGRADQDQAVIAVVAEHRRLFQVEEAARTTAALARAEADLARVLLNQPYGDTGRSSLVDAGDDGGFGALRDVVEPWIKAVDRLARIEAEVAPHVGGGTPGPTIGIGPQARLDPDRRTRAEAMRAARQRPGMLGAGITAVGALALATTAPGPALAMLLVAVAIATWAFVLPWRTLHAAGVAERAQPEQVGVKASSGWVDERLAAFAGATRDRDRCRVELQRRILQLEQAAHAAMTQAQTAADAQVVLQAEVGVEVAAGEHAGLGAGRVEAVSRALEEARRRDDARAELRSGEDVAAQIEQLEAEATARWRPRWAAMTGLPPRPPNLAHLERRRQAVAGRLRTIEQRSRDLSTVTGPCGSGPAASRRASAGPGPTRTTWPSGYWPGSPSPGTVWPANPSRSSSTTPSCGSRRSLAAS
ncbi:MAG: hypothetical protein WKF43_08375 [Acidimicrobiales bacterium]